MKLKVNEEYRPLFLDNSRYKILMGGRGGGRSTVASQYAIARLLDKDYFRCAIMRYILGDIRNSIYREIIDRIEENQLDLKINDSLMKIESGANSINAVGFKKSSGDQKSKLKSLASYNTVIIEEADEVLEEDFMQLDDSLRTVKGDLSIILLLNPPARNHWIVNRWLDLEESEQKGFYEYKLKASAEDAILVNTNYKDNLANISPQSVKQYEKYKETKPDHYWNMVVGLIPEVVKGKIYNDWKILDEVPHEARLVRYGLDFGYSNDPTALIAVYYYNGGYILDEVMYQKGLSNKQIADTILINKPALVIADSAEPKSIDEIRLYGVNIMSSEKGQGSVNQGIQYVQDQQISITRRSKNLLKEYENYAWKVDKDGEVLNVPAPGWDHGCDALRYAIQSLQAVTNDDVDVPDDAELFDSQGFY